MVDGAACRRCVYAKDRRFFRLGMECHRYPPMPVGRRAIRVETPGDQDPGWFFPQMHPENWCGEFKLADVERRNIDAPTKEST